MRHPLTSAALLGCLLCAAASSVRAAEPAPSGSAFIIGRYSVNCTMKGDDCRPPYNSISLFYKGVDGTKGKGELEFKDSIYGKTPPDFTEPAMPYKGIYFCQPIKPGKYAFFSFSYWDYKWGGSGYGLPKNAQFNLAFEARAGEVVDLGSVLMTTKAQKLLGMTQHVPGFIVLGKNEDADRTRALQRCLAAKDLPVRVEPLSASQANHPIITDEE